MLLFRLILRFLFVLLLIILLLILLILFIVLFIILFTIIHNFILLSCLLQKTFRSHSIAFGIVFIHRSRTYLILPTHKLRVR